MSGVTHFERRDRQKRIHVECHFCGKKIKTTPRGIAGPRGDTWLGGWIGHLRDHLLDGPEGPGHIGNIEAALRMAMSVWAEFDRNR
jgi:hypothetical protein